MYRTIADARTRWCVFARMVPQMIVDQPAAPGIIGKQGTAKIPGNPGNVFMQENGQPFFIPCVAENCMQWRWNPANPHEGCCGLSFKPLPVDRL